MAPRHDERGEPPRLHLGRFLLLILALASLAARTPASHDIAEIKIRLLSEALHARDSGDTAAARKNLQEKLRSFAIAKGYLSKELRSIMAKNDEDVIEKIKEMSLKEIRLKESEIIDDDLEKALKMSLEQK